MQVSVANCCSTIGYVFNDRAPNFYFLRQPRVINQQKQIKVYNL